MFRQAVYGGFLVIAAAILASARKDHTMTSIHVESGEVITLTKPLQKGAMSLEEALARRQSCREFRSKALTKNALSQLLWAAQGISRGGVYRTAPSAGALYPLEVYVATSEGFYHYEPRRHRLKRHLEDDLRPVIYGAGLEQEALLEAPAVFVIAGVYERAAQKYGKTRAVRYVQLEAGHAAQNLLLQAVTLGLGAVPIGAFEDARVHRALSLPEKHRPLYLIPVGHAR